MPDYNFKGGMPAMGGAPQQPPPVSQPMGMDNRMQRTPVATGLGAMPGQVQNTSMQAQPFLGAEARPMNQPMAQGGLMGAGLSQSARPGMSQPQPTSGMMPPGMIQGQPGGGKQGMPTSQGGSKMGGPGSQLGSKLGQSAPQGGKSGLQINPSKFGGGGGGYGGGGFGGPPPAMGYPPQGGAMNYSPMNYQQY